MKRLVLVLLTICLVFALAGVASADVRVAPGEAIPIWGIDACSEVWVYPDGHDPIQGRANGHSWIAELVPWWGLGPEYVTYWTEIDGRLFGPTSEWFDVVKTPYSDVSATDWDLYLNAWLVTDAGLIEGYSRGSLGCWDQLTRRHVYLIASRSGLTASSVWQSDYTPITRGEVRDAIPGLEWDSDRWDEPLLRGQLVRLLGRTLQ